MTSFQRVIKYFAIAFAVLILFNIATGIIYGIKFVGDIFSDNKINDSKLEKVDIYDDYSILEIEVSNADIIIKEGDNFEIEKSEANIKVKELGNKLIITEKKYGLFEEKSYGELVIYVPNDYVFDEVSIENGNARIDVDCLSSRSLELDLGNGKVDLNKLYISDEMSIDSGIGEVIVNDSHVNNLDLDMGLGSVELNLILTGRSEINAGIGEVNLFLLDSRDNYRFNVEKGIGNIMIDGNKITKNGYYGDGKNTINIEGGIGSINVDFDGS